MCVDVHAAASLKSGRVLGSKSRLWRGMGVSAQSVSPKFYSSRTRPSEPGSPSSHQEPPAGIELVQVRSVELAVQPKPVFNVVHQAVHEAIRIHRNGWHFINPHVFIAYISLPMISLINALHVLRRVRAQSCR